MEFVYTTSEVEDLAIDAFLRLGRTPLWSPLLGDPTDQVKQAFIRAAISERLASLKAEVEHLNALASADDPESADAILTAHAAISRRQAKVIEASKEIDPSTLAKNHPENQPA